MSTLTESRVVSRQATPTSLVQSIATSTNENNKSFSTRRLYKATSQRLAPSVHASIPSKYQTFFTAFKEDLGFNSCSVRFPELPHCVDDNPGPASYATYRTSTMTAPQESLSKRGTGGFASKTKRFSRSRSKRLGPGSYNPQLPTGRVDFNRSTVSRNFQQPLISQLHPPHNGGPAPNTYNITTSQISQSRYITGEAAFKSKIKRDSLLLSNCHTNPGPAKYNPSDHLTYRTACFQQANFLSKTQRHVVTSREDRPGPADYSISQDSSEPRQYNRQKHYLCISAPAIPLPSLPPPPGPGHYEVVQCEREKQLVSGAVFKSTSSRCKGLSSHLDQPGPGTYDPKLKGKTSFLYNYNQHWI